MRSFLVDSNVFIEVFKGDIIVENFFMKLFYLNWWVFINDVVFSEVFYYYFCIKVGFYWKVKKKFEFVKFVVQEFEEVVLFFFVIFDFFEVNYDVVIIVVRLFFEYSLLFNDVFLFVIVEYYGIEVLVFFDLDFLDVCNREGILLVLYLNELEVQL